MPKFTTLLFFISICLLEACKKDNPPPTVSFYVKHFQVDGLPQKANYNGVSLTPQIVVSFSAPVNRSSVVGQIVLAGNSVIPLTLSYSNSDSTVSITTVNPLQALTNYQFVILPNVLSSSNHRLSSSLSINIVTAVDPTPKFPTISDTALVTLVQQQTFKYFYNFAEPNSGMARERDTSGDLVTTGGSGFGLMALIVGVQRNFITRPQGIAQFNKIISFLETANRFHGAWPHWMNGTTGAVIPFGTQDDGADLVETSFMVQGLLTVRQYLTPSDTVGNNLINRINKLWWAVEFDWFRQNNQQTLYWHWSPNYNWSSNMQINGYDEALVVYLLAAGSPTHTIPASVYQQGWALNGSIKNGKSFYNYPLPVGQDYGGPLFFTHYSFLGFNPHTTDAYANYWTQNQNHALINYSYCVANPKNYAGYGANCWGLTASDNPAGYDAQSPTNDNGTITPTAAISSMPYTPTQSMNAIKYFYYTLGDRMWGTYGFHDAFNISQAWTATSYLAIDQGPIVVMIENYRTQLLWNLFMSCPEVQAAKAKLGFN